MAILIDTNVAIYLRDGDDEIIDRSRHFRTIPSISIITRVELEAGVATKPELSIARRLRTDELLIDFRVIDFDVRTADAYRDILSKCGYSRSRVFDRLIAATAIAYDLTLITINGPDFRDILALRLEIWPAPAQ